MLSEGLEVCYCLCKKSHIKPALLWKLHVIYAVVLPKTCKHTSMFNIGGDSLYIFHDAFHIVISSCNRFLKWLTDEDKHVERQKTMFNVAQGYTKF